MLVNWLRLALVMTEIGHIVLVVLPHLHLRQRENGKPVPVSVRKFQWMRPELG